MRRRVAGLYKQRGGPVVYAGKPYRPSTGSRSKPSTSLAQTDVAQSEVLAIGDGVNTDMAGAADVGIDAVFVASGLHVPSNSGEGGGDTLDRRIWPSCSRTSRRARSAPCAPSKW